MYVNEVEKRGGAACDIDWLYIKQLKRKKAKIYM